MKVKDFDNIKMHGTTMKKKIASSPLQERTTNFYPETDKPLSHPRVQFI
jgi:hypothetical protein